MNYQKGVVKYFLAIIEALLFLFLKILFDTDTFTWNYKKSCERERGSDTQ